MLVDGMIPAGMVGSIHAAGGEGKTLVAIYLALQAMRRGFKVAFLDKENGAHIMRERFERNGLMSLLPVVRSWDEALRRARPQAAAVN